MKRDLSFEVVYPYPRSEVWQALTDSRILAQWLMENDFEPRVGHIFQFHTQPRPRLGFDGIVYCTVLEVDEPQRISYSWRGGRMKQPTIVTWILEEAPEGTRVILEHTGFEDAYGLLASMALGPGWRRILHRKLPGIIERMTV